MRKMIVFLLIVGIIFGMITATENMSEESSLSSAESSYDIVEGGDNPTPCGGGGGGAGGGAPG